MSFIIYSGLFFVWSNILFKYKLIIPNLINIIPEKKEIAINKEGIPVADILKSLIVNE